MAHDTFFPAHRESIALGCVVRNGTPRLSLFSLHAQPGERFLGTGERFSRFGLTRLHDRAGEHRRSWGFLATGIQERTVLRVQRRVRAVRSYLVPKPSVVRQHFLPGRPGQRGIGLPGPVLHRWRLCRVDRAQLPASHRRPSPSPAVELRRLDGAHDVLLSERSPRRGPGNEEGRLPLRCYSSGYRVRSRRTGAANGSSAPRGSLTLKDFFAKCGIWDSGSVSGSCRL